MKQYLIDRYHYWRFRSYAKKWHKEKLREERKKYGYPINELDRTLMDDVRALVCELFSFLPKD